MLNKRFFNNFEYFYSLNHPFFLEKFIYFQNKYEKLCDHFKINQYENTQKTVKYFKNLNISVYRVLNVESENI